MATKKEQENELWRVLSESETLTVEGRKLLRQYFIDQLARYESDPEQGEALAYTMAGLPATRALFNYGQTNRDDPYWKVLNYAGTLELPPHQRDGLTWEDFAVLVHGLPVL